MRNPKFPWEIMRNFLHRLHHLLSSQKWCIVCFVRHMKNIGKEACITLIYGPFSSRTTYDVHGVMVRFMDGDVLIWHTKGFKLAHELENISVGHFSFLLKYSLTMGWIDGLCLHVFIVNLTNFVDLHVCMFEGVRWKCLFVHALL